MVSARGAGGPALLQDIWTDTGTLTHELLALGQRSKRVPSLCTWLRALCFPTISVISIRNRPLRLNTTRCSQNNPWFPF